MLEQTSCRSVDFLSRYLTMFLRGASLIINTLQDWTRVGKRAGASGVGSLGTSWLSCDGKTSYSNAGKIDDSSHNLAVLSVESAQNQSGQTKVERTFAHLLYLLQCMWLLE